MIDSLSLTKSEIASKPFLRWAGGKSWLMQYLSEIRRSEYNNYHEAFLGGGATFFSLKPQHEVFLSDLNNDLIETYQVVRDDLHNLIGIMKGFKNTEKFYYEIRGTQYETATERAARFIYLNQTSYNGIYRVNLKGAYNVPFGFRTKNFLNEEILATASKSLRNVTLLNGDFYLVMNNVQPGDLIFLDPPYTVSHNDNGFIKYNEKLFSLDDQIRLSSMIDEIREKDALYILTNAAHSTIESIFEKGDRKLKFHRASLIGGLNAERGQTSELVFTNTNL